MKGKGYGRCVIQDMRGNACKSAEKIENRLDRRRNLRYIKKTLLCGEKWNIICWLYCFASGMCRKILAAKGFDKLKKKM